MSSVLAPPPLLPLLELELEPPPPHAVTPAASATRQPEAAIQREFKEPLLMGIVNGRRFYAPFPPEGNHARTGGGMPIATAPSGAEWSVARALAAGEELHQDVRCGGHEQHEDRDHEGV